MERGVSYLLVGITDDGAAVSSWMNWYDTVSCDTRQSGGKRFKREHTDAVCGRLRRKDVTYMRNNYMRPLEWRIIVGDIY